MQSTTSPLVSIVTPFLNPGRFLLDAVESVLSQDYQRWELLLVDDGSIDESTGIARALADKNPDRIRVYQHEHHANKGISASRNLGVRHSTGDILMWLDADDVWLPGKMKHQLNMLERFKEADVTYGATEYWRSWTTTDGIAGADETPDLGWEPGVVFPPCTLATVNYPLGKNTAPSMNAVCIRRSAFEQVGGCEDRFVGMYEDQALLTKLYVHARFVLSTFVCDRYRLHPDSVCAKAYAAERYDEARCDYLRWYQKYLDDATVTDGQVRRALESALLPYESGQSTSAGAR